MGEEDHLLTQWKEKRQQVDVALSRIEEEADNFTEIPHDMLMIEAAMEEHDVRTLCSHYAVCLFSQKMTVLFELLQLWVRQVLTHSSIFKL